jgi:hypothetical protein
MPPDVRRPLFQGSQQVRGLWFDCALLGEAEARRRVLAAWERDARAWRVRDGYLLAWTRPRRLICAHAPGLPLCDQDGVLASAPLAAAERARLQPGAVVLVFGAGMHVHVPAPDQRVDPSLWLDVAALPLLMPLRMPAGAAADFVPSVPAAAADVRAVLGDAVPPPSPLRAEFLRRAREAPAPAGGAVGLAGRAAGALGLAAAVAGSVAGSVAGLLLRSLRRLPGTPSAPAGAAAPPGPGHRWLADRLARLALVTRLSSLLGWRQANYLRRMLRQFERGDFDEALRHAIPLDGAGATGRRALGTPGRRANLDISARRDGAAGIGIAPHTMDVLRAAYRRSFDMLDRAGRIDEAVFVLAELLNRPQEAVDYLERHGRIAQAARLAETLQLAPALIVRLHFMAGAAERAVQLARLTDAFGDAVSELERRSDARASGLRIEWACELAARGNVCEAAAVLWPLAQERHRALAWLQAAAQAGGDLGVQGLVYRLALDPASLRDAGCAVHDLLHAQGEEAARLRMRACDCLLRLDVRHDAVRRAGAELWRSLVADRGAGLGGVPRDRLKALAKLAADPVLAADAPKADLPQEPAAATLRARRAPLRATFAERGVLPLEDVRVMPDGGYLLGLGESGAALARADGREIVRFPVPAHHLVLARNGRRALALGRRENAVRVARIDLLNRTASDWFSADLRFWAGDYDGTTWNVVADERLMALDTAARDRSVLWQIGGLPGRIIGFDQQDDAQALLLSAPSGVEQWRYALPDRRLLQRDQFALGHDAAIVLPDCHGTEPIVLDVRTAAAGDGTVVLALPRCAHGAGARIDLPARGPLRASLHDGLLLLGFDAADGWHCQLVDFAGHVLADVVLPDAAGARAHVHAGHLLAWDRAGRLVDIAIGTSLVRTLTLG